MAILSAAEIAARINANETVLGKDAPSKDHVYNLPSEIPGSNPTNPSWNPDPITEDNKNAVYIKGFPVHGTPNDGDAVLFEDVNKRFVFAPVSGGGGGGSMTVRAADGSPSYSSTVIEFDEADGFVLSTPGLNQARVKLTSIPFSKLAALTADKILITNGSGVIVPSMAPASKIDFISNVTSDIQSQLNAKPNTAITALTGDVTGSGSGSVETSLSTMPGLSAGTYTKVTVDTKGRVTTGANLSSGDLPSHSHLLASLTDFAITSPANGQGLLYNSGTGKWTNQNLPSGGGGSSSYTFEVNFTGTDPTSATSLPSGWGISFAGTQVTVTHTVGAMPAVLTFYGYNTDSGPAVWRYRTPTAGNEMSILDSTKTTQFSFALSTTIATASAGAKATVKVTF